jgi:hypothetical protein
LADNAIRAVRYSGMFNEFVLRGKT